MLQATPIYASPILRITDVTCDAHRGGCGDVETVSTLKVVLPRSGAFAYHFSGTDHFVADANIAIVLHPGVPYKVSHPIDGGDACTVFEFADEELLRGLRGAASLGKRGGFAARLARASAMRSADARAVDEYAMTLIDALVQVDPAARHSVVECAKAAIAEDPFDNRSLSDLAREVGVSPFYLTRTFKRTTGTSLHAYRMRLRLASGLERACEGESLSRVAVDCGFSNHSQFTAAFRKHFGVAPSQARKISTAL
ncbi:MAG TPA: AraC family transcriptional regulator [Candidatus Baltobacteraceae bacterium]|nr:AraC family transcriptional regulator [Candidatus Baltobacteraceae bacterium]